jgi:hypothetical protein
MRWLEMQMQSNAAQLNLGVFSNAAWPGVSVAQFNTKEIKRTKKKVSGLPCLHSFIMKSGGKVQDK